MDWLITLPKTIEWDEYQKELDAVSEYESELYYRVHYFPKKMRVGDRIFVLWRGRVRGWMSLVGLTHKEGFVCSSTNRGWPEGKYLVRSGPFHPIEGPEMESFRGIRRLESSEF